MNKVIKYNKSVFAFSLLVSLISCQKVNGLNEIDIISISESKEFSEFINISDQFNSPFAQKISSMSKEDWALFIDEKEPMLNRFKYLSFEEALGDLEDIVIEMGYDSVATYNKLYIQSVNAYESFLKAYPELNEVDKKLRDEALMEAYSLLITNGIRKHKSFSDCADDYGNCTNMAYGYYMLGVAGCTATILGSPALALICHLGISGAYHAELNNCVNEFNACELAESEG